MARMLKEYERLIQVASGSIRGPDGSIELNVPMYVIMPKDSINPATGMSPGETEAFDDIAAIMLSMHKQYVDSVAALENKRAGAGALV